MKARATFVEVDGVTQPAPAPRFRRTPGQIGCPPRVAGQDTGELLAEAGYSEDEVAALERDAVVARASADRS